MSGLDGKLIHKATWWSAVPDGYGGDIVGSPTVIDCRWEERSEAYIGQIDRRETISNAIVFVDRDISVGDYLVKGEFPNSLDPASLAGSFKVQRFDRVADLRGLFEVRRAVL